MPIGILDPCQRCEGHGPLTVHLRGPFDSYRGRTYLDETITLCAYCKAWFEDETEVEVTEI